jgi:3-oxoacyl-[acyl-carrier-protein] synthase-3
MRDRHATITATGSYVPDRVVTNDELSERLGEDIDDFVSNVLGIRERRFCAEDESTADLAEAAGRQALETAGVAPEEVDLLIVSTDTPEYVTPATSAVVQHRLGLEEAGVFDLNSACAGFVTALDVAAKYLRADERYRKILVVAAYAMSKYLDLDDKKTATIFADGAGAVLVEPAGRPGVLASELRADGSYAGYMGVYAGGTAEPVDREVLEEGVRNHVRFVHKYPPEVNEEGWPDIVRQLLDRVGRSTRDVDLYLFTQVNRSTIQAVMERLGEPMEKAHTVMGEWGYTGSACIAMALDDAVRKDRLSEGDLVAMTASGAGLSMGSLLMEWNPGSRP